MYSLLLIVLFIVVVIINKLLYKNSCSLLKLNIVFTGLWAFMALLASNEYLGVWPMHVYVEYNIVCMLILYNIVYYIINNNLRYINNGMTVYPNVDINYILTIIICLIILSLPIFKRAIPLFLTVGFAGMREYAFIASDKYLSGFDIFLQTVVIQSIYTASYIFFVALCIFKQFSFKYAIVILISGILNTFLFGGRDSIYLLFILFIIYNYLNYELYGIKKRELIKKIAILVPILCCALWLVSLRKNEDLSVIDTVLTYYYCPLNFLSQLIQLYPPGNFFYGGQATMDFIIYLPNLILRQFNRAIGYGPFFDICNMAASQIYIGSNLKYNALGSLLMIGFYDFGNYWAFLSILPLSVFAGIVDRLYYTNKKNLYTVSLKIFALITCIKTLQAYPMSIHFTITVLFIYIFSHCNIKKGTYT